jgi:hypothetical protein
LFGETPPFQLDPAVEDHIGGWLDRCRARGLFTTLCFRSGPGRSAFAFHPEEDWYPAALYDDSLWRDADKQAAWVEMVAETLRRFGDHPALAGIVPGGGAQWDRSGASYGLAGYGAAPGGAGSPRQPGSQYAAHLEPGSLGAGGSGGPLRDAVGEDAVLALHHYEPWRYSHQGEGDEVAFNPQTMGASDVEAVSGDWAALEFGVVRHAPDPQRYLRDRIAKWERLGANWAVFRWTSGWDVYERREGAMNTFEDARLLRLLRRAFAANRVRPD